MKALRQVDFFTVLCPNGEWSSGRTVNIDRQLQPNISFAQHLDHNFQTLSTPVGDRDSVIDGFLYVPDLDPTSDCNSMVENLIPANVTRKANLPPEDFTLVALAPWVDANCTQAYLASTRHDHAQAFLFYLPDTAESLPPSDSPAWNLGNGGGWKTQNPIAVYGISGSIGVELMHQLSLYSGNMTEVPYGHDISELPDIDPRDYVRIFAQLSADSQTHIPAIWAFFLIIIAALACVLGITSAIMHLLQRARTNSLRRRVASGEVNLEALGITQLTVPHYIIDRFALYTYNHERHPSVLIPSCHERQFRTSSQEQDGINTGNLAAVKTAFSTTQEGQVQATTSAQTFVLEDVTSHNLKSHKHLPYSQSMCCICWEDFQSGVTEVRELPCGHIFHPNCIGSFLANNSSLCPLCKQSVLPNGYCPAKLTYDMVRREMSLRRLRARVTLADEELGEINASLDRIGHLPWLHSFKIHWCLISISRHLPGSVADVSRPVPSVTDLRTISISPEREAVEQRLRGLTGESTGGLDTMSLSHQSYWRNLVLRVFPGF